jgi:hypothetical protein
VFNWSRGCTLVVLFIQTITNFFVKSFNDGKVINELSHIIKYYLTHSFKWDLLEIIFLVLDMQIESEIIMYCCVRIVLKLPFILNELERIKHMVCINAQR